ncbi:MAG: type I methionyl aminopeptidase [Bacteroidetes bacterium HGW-Bacteroidetes-1]|jgi:methionyl aminopeptidase|nr:MAG: type I methionyl aminopeptidase [Bacteroidetes bacterium HGW-Bacteroidetes-1]
MIQIKTEEEIELQRESSLLVGKTLAEVAKNIKPGVKTKKLDELAETFIRDHHAKPGFKGYGGFPATLCISVNDEVVHGIPGESYLNDGDIVSVDCGVLKNGFFGDSAYTFSVGNVAKEVVDLMERTKQSLYLGIEQAVDGKRIGDIGYAIQSYIEPFGYGIVRELVGHGVGRQLHEKPEVPNYGRRGTGVRLSSGMVIAIEPMINLGKRNVSQDTDGWTIRTSDRLPSAHYEHTVAIRNNKADILSSFEYIETVLNRMNGL